MKHIPWEFKKNRSILLVIDMQNDFVQEGAVMEVPMARHFIPNMSRILDVCREQSIPVIYTQHVLYESFDVSPLETAYQPILKTKGMRSGTKGIDIVPELKPLENEIIISKHRYDAFYNTQLETIIRNIRGDNLTDTIIIVGTVTNICCESTARSAFMRDFKVVFIEDANGGLDHVSQAATLNIIGKVFGRIMSTEELITEIKDLEHQ